MRGQNTEIVSGVRKAQYSEAKVSAEKRVGRGRFSEKARICERSKGETGEETFFPEQPEDFATVVKRQMEEPAMDSENSESARMSDTGKKELMETGDQEKAAMVEGDPDGMAEAAQNQNQSQNQNEKFSLGVSGNESAHSPESSGIKVEAGAGELDGELNRSGSAGAGGEVESAKGRTQNVSSEPGVSGEIVERQAGGKGEVSVRNEGMRVQAESVIADKTAQSQNQNQNQNEKFSLGVSGNESARSPESSGIKVEAGVGELDGELNRSGSVVAGGEVESAKGRTQNVSSEPGGSGETAERQAGGKGEVSVSNEGMRVQAESVSAEKLAKQDRGVVSQSFVEKPAVEPEKSSFRVDSDRFQQEVEPVGRSEGGLKGESGDLQSDAGSGEGKMSSEYLSRQAGVLMDGEAGDDGVEKADSFKILSEPLRQEVHQVLEQVSRLETGEPVSVGQIRTLESRGFSEMLPRICKLEEAVEKFEENLLQLASQKGSSSMTINLDPPSLGRIVINCRESEGQMYLDFAADSRFTRSFLSGQEQVIRDIASENGFKLLQFDVRDNSGGNPDGAGARHYRAAGRGAGLRERYAVVDVPETTGSDMFGPGWVQKEYAGGSKLWLVA